MLQCDRRSALLERQLSDYGMLLSDYAKEMEVGQVSVLDYIGILRSKIQLERELQLLQTNRQLLIAAYNYWSY